MPSPTNWRFERPTRSRGTRRWRTCCARRKRNAGGSPRAGTDKRDGTRSRYYQHHLHPSDETKYDATCDAESRRGWYDGLRCNAPKAFHMSRHSFYIDSECGALSILSVSQSDCCEHSRAARPSGNSQAYSHRHYRCDPGCSCLVVLPPCPNKRPETIYAIGHTPEYHVHNIDAISDG